MLAISFTWTGYLVKKIDLQLTLNINSKNKYVSYKDTDIEID